jgi:hypothetical protein
MTEGIANPRSLSEAEKQRVKDELLTITKFLNDAKNASRTQSKLVPLLNFLVGKSISQEVQKRSQIAVEFNINAADEFKVSQDVGRLRHKLREYNSDRTPDVELWIPKKQYGVIFKFADRRPKVQSAVPQKAQLPDVPITRGGQGPPDTAAAREREFLTAQGSLQLEKFPSKAAVILVDWESSCRRECKWQTELQGVTAGCKEVPLATVILNAQEQDAQELLQLRTRHQILIFNWDSINGDDRFGSGEALKWVRHNRKVLLNWVAQGGILIVEGQCKLYVPCQRSYNALFGHKEVGVSPRPNKKRGLAHELTGWNCIVTAGPGKKKLLGRIKSVVGSTEEREKWFSEGAASMVESGRYPMPFYRGWFTEIRGRACKWVPLIKTNDKHSSGDAVLLGGRYKEGVIFLSTLLLAGKPKPPLIEALIKLGSNASAWS